MIDVAEQQAARRLVHNQTNVGADAYRPEVLVLRFFDRVELHPGIDRIELQIKGCRLGGLLLIACQTSEAVSEGVGDAEVHISDSGGHCGC